MLGASKNAFMFSVTRSTHRTQCTVVFVDDIFSKCYKAKSAKEKFCGVKSRGNEAQDSKSSPPVELPRMHLIFTSVNCDNRCKCIAFQGSSLETQCPRFCDLVI